MELQKVLSPSSASPLTSAAKTGLKPEPRLLVPRALHSQGTARASQTTGEAGTCSTMVSPVVSPTRKPPGRLMRIQTLREDKSGKPTQNKKGPGVVELPVGSWEEVDRDTWQGHLLYPRSFYDQFNAHIKRSSDAIFGEGKGPLADITNDPSGLRPDLGPAAQKLVEVEGGKTKWFSLMGCFPASKDSLQQIGDILLLLFVLDDWLENQGVKEAEAASEWWRQLWLMSCSGDYSQASASIPACFARDPHLYKAVSAYIAVQNAYNAEAIEVHPDWPRRIAWAWYLYSLGVIDEMKASQVYKETQRLPTMWEYLRFRTYSIGDMLVTVMAAIESGVCLSVDRLKRAIPLLVYTALIIGVLNDTLPASKDPADGVLDLVNIASQQQAVHVHNILVDCLCAEIDQFLADAKPGDSSQEFVDVVRASIFGLFLWHTTVPRYRRHVENTRQPVAIADCAEGQLTDTRSPLYREVRELVASISRDMPSELP